MTQALFKQTDRCLQLLQAHQLFITTGNNHPIRYDGDAPVLAIRVQELFGLKEHPSIAQGTVPLLLELLEDRQQRGSVLVTSQLPIKLWHGQFQDPTLADAILDRLVHNAELIELTGESMRKKNQRSSTNEDKSDPTI